MRLPTETSWPLCYYVVLAFKATFHPIQVARQIQLGEREDLNLRIRFFFGTAIGLIVVQSLVAVSLGLPAFPTMGVAAVWQYLSPFIGAGCVILTYLPLWLLGWVRVSFTAYFQATAMSMGAELFRMPFDWLPGVLAKTIYGQPHTADPVVQEIVTAADNRTLDACGPAFDSLFCLIAFGATAPVALWVGVLGLIVGYALLVPVFIIIKHATGVLYWKQIVAYAVLYIFAPGLLVSILTSLI